MSKKALPLYIVIQKKRGETPLELLQKWQSEHPEFAGVPLSYAGRLDPMAEGKLLVLVGEECKKQDLYTKLDKEYEIEVLLGVKTDTGDVLGIVNALAKRTGAALPRPSSTEISKALKRELGSHSRRYPIFSSKTVNGKPLFLYALEGTVKDISIPEHIETMYKISKLGTEVVRAAELRGRIQNLLSLVPRSDEPSKALGADFRQDEIRMKWDTYFSEILDQKPAQEFTILRLRIICGSGAYMRTLAERIGTTMGTDAFALSINRTKIGKYVQLGPVSLWSKLY